MGLIHTFKDLVDFLGEVAGKPYKPPPGACFEGPDDLWPPESPDPEPEKEKKEEPQIADTASEPELVVTRQWGLRLPDGRIAWNSWSGITFDDPLDRVRMIANLQKTAEQVAFEQQDFLAHYGWVTRNQIAAVVYEDTGAYSLTDSEVSARSTPTGEQDDGTTNDDSSQRDGGGLHQGSVGGDAQ